ncbi:adenine phosphoribosyltransferase [Patescibacteria group bacterium]
MTNLKDFIIDVPNFPKDGVVFKDISPLLGSPEARSHTINLMADACKDIHIDAIAGFDSRGFLFGPTLADKVNKPFTMIRKAGKLPGPTVRESYNLEYGSATIEMQINPDFKNKNILLLDDVLATGGTASAGEKLVKKTGNHVAGFCFLIELSGLNGKDLLESENIFSLLSY